MTLPVRLIQAVRPQASAGVVAGAAMVAAVFASTPLLLPDVATRLEVPLGTTGLMSTAQVASFALASFLAGRLLRPRRRYHYGAIILVVVANAASALAPNFPLLVGARVAAGLGLGTLTWIAWADATRFTRGMGDVAAIGPISAAIASPLIALTIEHAGYRWVFAGLAIVALSALAFRVDFADLPRVGRTVSPSRSNRLLLGALLLMTLGGSSVFIFAGATGTGFIGLSPVAVAWALSINAMSGVAGTRVTARPGTTGLWLLGTAIAALLVGNIASVPLFFVALALWGFSFWVVLPGALRMLAERSLVPSERMGDAQAVMAVGRVVGPVIGGIAIAGESYGRLSVVGASIMLAAAVMITAIELGRRKLPPTAASTVDT